MDYEKAYSLLFNSITEAIEKIGKGLAALESARKILIRA